MDKLMSNYLLVIEDEPIIRVKIIKKLTNFINSEKIKSSAHIEEALHLLNSFHFKIIILDLNLSDGHGITILNQLRKDDLKSLVYVFSINSELKNICIQKGATSFFDKSKDFNALISTVRAAYRSI